MSEQFEKVLELEIHFYLNFKQYEQEIYDRPQENEMNIHYPITIFDEEQGRIYRQCSGTEQQAIRRIEIRDSLNAILEKAKKRIARFQNAYSQLSDDEKDIVFYTYFDESYKEFQLTRILGLKSVKDLHREQKNVLKKLYKIYNKEREDYEKEFKNFLLEERKRRSKTWLENYKLKNGV